jgi:hypothetical protein
MHPDWFRDKKVNIMVQIGLEKQRDLSDVPNALDLVPNAKTSRCWADPRPPGDGRPFAMPANVPADRVAILRAAFEATLKDPAFIADAQKLQMEIDPLTGAQIQDLLKTAYATPRPIVQRAAQFVR